ncbi:hypothetical protein AU192_04170 [Mycobacterium lehmannii]|uniref:Uncharacterized protein n=1 Tax=Mycobacterium lehmannii TaxID=2048550 RepID=A0A101A510_9MYCO|nr:hypothetical protein AU192_04170 [Mycobacterium lehmannii]
MSGPVAHVAVTFGVGEDAPLGAFAFGSSGLLGFVGFSRITAAGTFRRVRVVDMLATPRPVGSADPQRHLVARRFAVPGWLFGWGSVGLVGDGLHVERFVGWFVRARTRVFLSFFLPTSNYFG